MAANVQSTGHILISFRLGWLAVETFGLLRRYALHGVPPSPEKIEASQRFIFTDRSPNLYELLQISIQDMHAAIAQLEITPSPIPANPIVLLSKLKADRQEIDRLWGEFEHWSRDVWHTLLSQDPLAGQAFTCGGDLADTFWYAQGAGPAKLVDMLRSFRLMVVAERVDDLAAYLPEHAAQAIHHSLEHWGIGETIKGWDKDNLKDLLDRLEAQIKVWRDLLFGLRPADSYLTVRDRRQITWRAAAGTSGFVLLVGILSWLAVLFLSGLGRSLLGVETGLPTDSSKISSEVMAYLSNWQNWSALLATISSILAVLTGVIKGLSGWLWNFHSGLQQWLILERIKRRTFRHYRLPLSEKSA